MNKASLRLITVACLLVARCVAECELAFTLNPQLSNFSFSGAVVEPMTATLVAKEPGALVVMDGSLLAVLPEAAKCPNTVEALVEQLGGATFETTPELGPLQLFPTAVAVSAQPLLSARKPFQSLAFPASHNHLCGLLLRREYGPGMELRHAALEFRTQQVLSQPLLCCRPQGQAGSLANVTWTDVAFNFSTAPLAATGSSSSSSAPQFESEVDAGITEGYVLVTSLINPDPETVSLVGDTASNTTQVFVSADGGIARVELRNLNLTFRSIYYSTLMGKPLKGVMDYVLNGTIVMEAAVGCGTDCGAHGRCWPEANGTEAVCECECGWTGTPLGQQGLRALSGTQ